jgi:ABC-type Fe3+/spermidine/putrescine transport system ATPase subunit
MSEPVLEARGVRFGYGDQTVVDVTELVVASGEIVALLGANGAGKSTLFRLLLGLEKPQHGQIVVNGKSAGVFQRPHLFDGTVASNIAYGLQNVGAPERESRVNEMASVFGLVPLLHTSVQRLSGGEAQRVALARALALAPAHWRLRRMYCCSMNRPRTSMHHFDANFAMIYPARFACMRAPLSSSRMIQPMLSAWPIASP